MVVVDAVDRYAMEAVDKSRKDGIVEILTTIPNHLRAGGSQGSTENRQGKVAMDYWYCGRKGHKQSEWWKKRSDSDRSESNHGDVDRCQRAHYAECSR